jgi:hypothetical protein
LDNACASPEVNLSLSKECIKFTLKKIPATLTLSADKFVFREINKQTKKQLSVY